MIFESSRVRVIVNLFYRVNWPDKRIYPAIDLTASATRKEELLLGDDELRVSHAMRRQLHGVGPSEGMLELLGAMREDKFEQRPY